MNNFFENEWVFTEKDRNGKIVYQERGFNSLALEGTEAMLETFFRDNAVYAPAQFYIRLCNDTLQKTDNLLSIQNEPSGYGYSPKLVERSTAGLSTKELNDGDYRLVSKEVTFTASGGSIGPVTTAYLATSADNSGKLICFRALATTRTIADGHSGTIQMMIKLKPGN